MPFASSILAATRALALDVEAFLLPRVCLGCERPLRDERQRLCDVCRCDLRAIAPPHCDRCGQTLDVWDARTDAWDSRAQARARQRQGLQASRAPALQGLSSAEPGLQPGDGAAACCGFCRSWPAALAWAASAVWFDDGPARRLVHALKYEGWRSAAEPMGDAMRRSCAPRLAGVDALVPVPLGRTRRRERGLNQAAVLAEALSRRTAIPLERNALVRSRETTSQTALAPLARRANVAGAFAVTGPVRGRRLALVDDVLTTGATLAAAAEALATAGAVEIGAVTFARAEKPA